MDDTTDPPDISFLTMHAAELLVIFGIAATLQWLPWEEYKYTTDENYHNNPKNNELHQMS